MNIPTRLVQMILRGHADKFKAILQEELRNRASVLMERLYKQQTKDILNISESVVPSTPEIVQETKLEPVKWTPEKMYQLKDGNIGILTESERDMVAKLHESLNNDGKERLAKLLWESKETFNRILKLAKTQIKK